MSLEDLHGLGFLIAFTLAIAAGQLLRLLLRGPRSGVPDGASADLHPYELAFVARGANGAIAACVSSLTHRGFISVDAQGRLVRMSREPDRMLTSESVFRGVMTTAPMHRLERAILSGLGQSAGTPYHILRRMSWVREEAEKLALCPQQHDLLFSWTSWRLRALVAASPALVILALGLAAGWPRAGSDMEPSGSVHLVRVLIEQIVHLPLLIGAVFVLLRMPAFPRLTRRGDTVLARLRADKAALPGAVAALPQNATAEDVALVCGLFGDAALPGPLAALGAVFISADTRMTRSLPRTGGWARIGR